VKNSAHPIAVISTMIPNQYNMFMQLAVVEAGLHAHGVFGGKSKKQTLT
jgi:hypothetical protein